MLLILFKDVWADQHGHSTVGQQAVIFIISPGALSFLSHCVLLAFLIIRCKGYVIFSDALLEVTTTNKRAAPWTYTG